MPSVERSSESTLAQAQRWNNSHRRALSSAFEYVDQLVTNAVGGRARFARFAQA